MASSFITSCSTFSSFSFINFHFRYFLSNNFFSEKNYTSFFSYASIMINLCRAEILISLCFLAHGLSCPGYAKESEYQSTCHMNVVAAVVGTATGGFGLGVVYK